jgi:hypothetical protein
MGWVSTQRSERGENQNTQVFSFSFSFFFFNIDKDFEIVVLYLLDSRGHSGESFVQD